MWEKIKPSANDPSSATQRARRLEREIQDAAPVDQDPVGPVRDDRQTLYLQKQSFGYGGRVSFGVVIYAVPYTQWYRVQLDDAGTDLSCCLMTDTASLPFSVRGAGPLPPRTPVLVYHQRELPYGIILGCLPTVTPAGVPMFSDWISQGSGSGFRRERYYTEFPQLFAKSGGQKDFSSQRPLDSVSLGEWGKFSDLGSGFFLDPLMAFMRIDETCGLHLFYMDRLARLSGHNFDFRSAVSEQQIRLDAGEASHYSGATPYGWEAMGCYYPTEATREIPDKEVHFSAPYGKIEPATDDQTPIYRLEEFRGYDGQGFMRQLSLPRFDTPRRVAGARQMVGVFREQLSLDGGYALASRHSITISKRAFIEVPSRNKQVEDPAGDDLGRDNYKFAGLYGEGPTHHIADNVPPGDTLPHVLSAAAVLDSAAYAFNWKGMHPFHYHSLDWRTSENGVVQAPLPLSELMEEQYMRPPTATVERVDHRYNALYYELSSLISLLPEGGIVIRDGYGSEIKMVGGCIELSAPGDITFRSGRSTINYAGDDAIIRARNSVDVTAANHDVRIKAQQNLEALAGNAGVGRLLLECRSQGSAGNVTGVQGEDITQSGLILKAAQSNIAAYGHTIYLRTGATDTSIAGPIVLDADQGRQTIRVSTQQLLVHSATGVNVAIPGSDNVDMVYSFGKNTCLIPSSIQAEGGVIIQKNGIQCRGNVNVMGGTVSSDQSRNGLMGYLEPGKSPWIITNKNLEDSADNLANQKDALAEQYRTAFTDGYYAEGGVGDRQSIVDTQFSPRTPAQMRTTNYAIVQSYWQQLVRTNAGGSQVWQEPVIVYQGEQMMPHPGKPRWADEESFLKPQLRLHDVQTGRDVSRDDGSAYESLEPAAWEPGVPANNYHVIT